ncbi:1-acyl-sn-glycerol-3-phosphate acyltransferase [Thermodesulfobacteriota bacterium]
MSKGTRSFFTKSGEKLREWIGKLLQGSHNHFFIYLPERMGFLSSWFFKLFYSGLKVPNSQTDILKGLPDEAIIIYVNKYKSYFEYLFYNTHYRQHKLPFPKIGFDYTIIVWQPLLRIIRVVLSYLDYFCQNLVFPNPYESGYLRQELLDKRCGFLSLVEKRRFSKWFFKAKADPIRFLIGVQKSMGRPIYIIPQLMFFGRKPIPYIPSIIDVLFGTEQRPGNLRRIITLFRNPEKIFVEISDPVNLKHFLEKAENRERTDDHLALILRHDLLMQINRHRQSITGPILKTKQEIKESILTNDRLQAYMNSYSEKRDIPIQKVRKEADGYLDEIAAKYNLGTIKFMEMAIRWIINLMFDGVTVNFANFIKVKNIAKQGPIIFIPCHKSHIDYLILSYLLYTNNMPCPHIAAGKNLSFWPIGPMFRGGGAFFIRRTFKGSVIYPKVFSEYIYKLLEEGFNIEFFIEGTRSRTGKLLTPKLGFLSILLNAFKSGACPDMIIVPIFIGYDRILEESSYLNEIEGAKKEPENIGQVIRARKFLKKKYGRIYIQFHDPISLNDLTSLSATSLHEMSSKEFNTFCRDLGYRIINAIDKVTVVTPHGLVASALLNCSQRRFCFDHILSHVETYLNYLFTQTVKLSDTLLHNHVHATEHVLKEYLQGKIIEEVAWDKENRPSQEQYRIRSNKRPALDYYKNGCIAFFIPAAYTALAILERDAFQFSASELHDSYGFLSHFFKNEFAPDADKSSEFLVRKSLKAFIDDAILMPHPTMPDTYNITSAGFRKLKLFARFLETFFESYWMALGYLKRNPKDSDNRKERLKKVQSLGNRMLKRDEIRLKEALSKVNYQNALDFFSREGLRGPKDEEKIAYFSDAVEKFLNILHL